MKKLTKKQVSEIGVKMTNIFSVEEIDAIISWKLLEQAEPFLNNSEERTQESNLKIIKNLFNISEE